MNLIREIQAKNNLVVIFQIQNVKRKIELKISLLLNFNFFKVLMVNELATHLNSQGKLGFKSAGGNLLAHRIHTKIRCKRQDDNTFAATILKNPLSPQSTVLFQVRIVIIKNSKIQLEK